MLVQLFLRTEGALLACGPRQVFAPSVHDAALAGVAQAIVHHRTQVGLDGWVVDWGNHLDAVVQIAGHPVGRTDEAFFLASGRKDEDARVLQVTVDDAVDMDGFADAGDACHQRAVAAQHDVDGHACGGCLIQLLHHHLIRNMVDFHPDVSGLAGQLVLDFVVYQAEELLLHLVGRDQQFAETDGRIGLLNKVEDIGHVRHHILRGGHKHEVRVDAGVAFVEVARADAGNVVARLHADMGNFAMHLQAFHAEDDVYAGILHQFGPRDIRRFVKACQQFDDHGDLLAIPCGVDEGGHHLRGLGQSVKGGLDALHVLADGCLLENADVIVKAVIRHVNVAVVLLDEFQEADVLVQFGLDDGRPGGIFQVLASTVGERHQVLVVVVASPGQDGIQFVEVQLVHHALQQVFGHPRIVDDTQRVALAAALDAFGNLLEHAVAQVVVYLHLGILGELEGVCLEVRVVHAAEYHGQAEADDIIEVHQVTLSLLVRQVDEASADGHGQFYQCIFGRLLVLGVHLHGQEDIIVGSLGQLLHGGEPDGVDKAAELLAEELAYEGLLVFAQLIVLQQEDVFPAEAFRHLVYGCLVFLGVLVVQFGDLLDELGGMFALLAHALVLVLRDAAQRGHADAEELVQVVRIDAQEAEPLQQGDIRLGSFLQNAPVEVHPTQVPVDIGFGHAFFIDSLSHLI